MEDPVGRESPVHEYVKVDTGARRRREECCRLRDQRIDLGAVERNAARGADFERDNADWFAASRTFTHVLRLGRHISADVEPRRWPGTCTGPRRRGDRCSVYTRC